MIVINPYLLQALVTKQPGRYGAPAALRHWDENTFAAPEEEKNQLCKNVFGDDGDVEIVIVWSSHTLCSAA